MSKFIDIHKEIINCSNGLYIDTISQLPNHQLNLFNPSEGQGFTELYDFNRLCIGKGKYWLRRPLQMTGNRHLFSFGITLLLSGTHYIKNSDLNQEYIIESPKIILRRGILGKQTIYLQANQEMSLLTLDFDQDLLEKLTPPEDASNFFIQFFLNSHSPAIHILEIPNKDIQHHAQYLLNLPTAKTVLDLLHLEGATLELISLLLKNKQYQHQALLPIKRAIEILDAQFYKKITIRDLAKQVGINECYLKQFFKETTGYTIGEYLLKARMRCAQSLLKEGFSLEYVAIQTGYSSAQYLKRVFMNFYHYEP
ncbi:helix-turn-helix transcriptional regulator [Acinetobacter rathckeae]|uniref:helix-turn-helix transcriptional regulator n=1 Tax=Acinetobacter rathckeae TaxID=2605272 RepID=UPI0018A312C2|nr:AraC family transcriptional regulator [Acinetobacter rathckeae]MBF7688359.1 helix-turn-helix transcriptional regulator [Acinetobacter rathckeae]MBF7695444.1 helix-turn-helix transcriptional regulator [Acinetobacter rathckeae]